MTLMKAKRIALLSAAMLIAALNCISQPSKFKMTYNHNGDAEWAKSCIFLSDSSIVCNSMFNTLSERGIITIKLANLAL